jgi:hypothetical protein
VLKRAFNQLRIPGLVVVVGEFNTSKMHHPEDVQRDDNAMLNIMEAGVCLIRGRPRPAYLSR